jgi:hypothetical protein
MTLQQPKCNSSAEHIDDEVDIRSRTKLPTPDRAPQDLARYFSPPLGELCQECAACLGVDLCFGD